MKHTYFPKFSKNYISKILLVIIILTSHPLFGQSNSTTLQFDRCKIGAITKQGNRGFIMKTYSGSKYGLANYSSSATLSYFDNTLTKKWTYETSENEYEDEEFFVANESTEFIYWMSSKFDKYRDRDGRSAKRLISIFRFDENGKPKKFKTEIMEDNSDVELLHIFSDAEKLYYFSVKPAELKKGKMISPEQVNLYTMTHNSNKFLKKTINIDLNKEGQVSFVGYSDNIIYLCQKRVDKKTNKMEITIFCLDKDGNEIQSFTIEPKNPNYYSPFEFPQDWGGDYSTHKFYTQKFEGQDLVFAKKTCNAFANIVFDKKFNRFCFYAITTDLNSQDEPESPPAKSILLQTYSLNGDYLTSLNISIENNPVNNKMLNDKMRWAGKSMHFNVLESDLFRIDFHDGFSEVTSFYLNSQKILSAAKTDKCYKSLFEEHHKYYYQMKLSLLTFEKYSIKSFHKYINPIEKYHSKEIDYSAIDFGNKVILIRLDDSKKETEIELMLFE